MRVLVVYKKSFLESQGEARGLLTCLHGPRRERVIRADIENRRVLSEVTSFLKDLGTSYDTLDRWDLPSRRRFDLVVTVGGDGTFLSAAHYVEGAAILGINAVPSASLGLWSIADRTTFRPLVRKALEGRLPGTKIHRMILTLNGEPLRERAFNDALLAHRIPATMTRYLVQAGGRREEQRGSGLWVATAAGSTAGIRSAGGRRMPVSARRLQFLVREPYGWPLPRLRLRHGFAPRLSAVALTTDLALWIDGGQVHYDLRMGDRVGFRSGTPLLVLGYGDARRRRLFP